MHELSIATALVEQAERTSRAYGGAAVTAVRVRVGELSGVVPDALRFSFDVARAGTAAERAPLVVEEVPARARCEPCGDVFAVGTPPMLWCPRCDTPAAELVGGRELEITAVELEGDPEVDGEPARAQPVPAGAATGRHGPAPHGAESPGAGSHGAEPGSTGSHRAGAHHAASDSAASDGAGGSGTGAYGAGPGSAESHGTGSHRAGSHEGAA